MARYTEGQERLLKLQTKKLSDEEKQMLNRALLPRSVYLPETGEECEALALSWLGEEKYEKMNAFLRELQRKYAGVELAWSRGSLRWGMYRSVRCGSRSFCRFGIGYRRLELILSFGVQECGMFERDRRLYPKDTVQWTYDFFVPQRGLRTMVFDVNETMEPYLWKLLSYKQAPEKRG